MSTKRKLESSNADVSEENRNKRIHLDSLFENLSLQNRTKCKPKDPTIKYSLNPQVKTNSGIHENPPNVFESMDDYIANKLYLVISEQYNKNNIIIQWYNPQLVIIYHFQKWVVRLFQRFYKAYHENLGIKSKQIRKYSQIIDMVNSKSSQFKLCHLISVLKEENHIEQIDFARKRDKHIKSERVIDLDDKELEILGKISYNYWDTIKPIDGDTDMFDFPLSPQSDDLDDMVE